MFEALAPEVMTGRFAEGVLIPRGFHDRPTAAALMRLLGDELDPKARRGRLFAEAVLRALALDLAGSAWSAPVTVRRSRQRADRRVDRAVEFIESDFMRELSLPQIAAAAGLSPSQLTTLMRERTGRTPWVYVLDTRLRHAARLLASTDMPIALVAYEAGFADQSHLTRLCRARLGRTPRQIRLGQS
jgi:AraC family transcriptional regulator